MNSLLITLAMVGIFSISYGQRDDFLKKYQWKNRVILLYAPSGMDEKLAKQNKVLAQDEAGIKERDLVIHQVTPDAEDIFDAVRSEYGLKESFTFVLIGKDGGVKKRSEDVVSLESLFSLIDSMPMRQSEMRRKDQ